MQIRHYFIGIFTTRMVGIKAKMKGDIPVDKQRTGNGCAQPDKVNNRIVPVPVQASKGAFEMVTYHCLSGDLLN